MDALHAEDVGELVGIGNDGCGAVREDGAGELVEHQLGGLDVHVGIDQARRHPGPGGVDPLPPPVVGADRDHVPVGDGDVRLQPLPREDAQHPAAGDDEVRRFVAPSDRHPAGDGGIAHSTCRSKKAKSRFQASSATASS